MEDFVPFASRDYFVVLALLLFGRGADIFSTWVATPNLVLEGNPVAKKLGWKFGVPVNAVFCFGFALWPLPGVVISVTSLLVAARNFQHAWLMRSLGEEVYRSWHVARILETRLSLFLFCLLGNTGLTAAVGALLIYFARDHFMPVAIGMGIVVYAITVAFYTLLSVWRIRRALG
ncbi:MAG TPA: hypothetical protein VH413_02780 [Verrucomicrobiae bacterium]|jgi:hypothetical protein|nr:hypothetical protein [Verrucomicrobiae bacterium]